MKEEQYILISKNENDLKENLLNELIKMKELKENIYSIVGDFEFTDLNFDKYNFDHSDLDTIISDSTLNDNEVNENLLKEFIVEGRR